MRFYHMPFGILSASEIIHKRNQEAFSDIPDVQVIVDDMIIATETVEEHDQILHTLCRELANNR